MINREIGKISHYVENKINSCRESKRLKRLNMGNEKWFDNNNRINNKFERYQKCMLLTKSTKLHIIISMENMLSDVTINFKNEVLIKIG